jgi:hypothetical protein
MRHVGIFTHARSAINHDQAQGGHELECLDSIRSDFEFRRR